MTDIPTQLPLFDQKPEITQDPFSQVSVPSAEFAIAHPDLVDNSHTKREVGDPNERRALQTAGVGGGIAAALRNELVGAGVQEVNVDKPELGMLGAMAISDALKARNAVANGGIAKSRDELDADSKLQARRALNRLGK